MSKTEDCKKLLVNHANFILKANSWCYEEPDIEDFYGDEDAFDLLSSQEQEKILEQAVEIKNPKHYGH